MRVELAEAPVARGPNVPYTFVNYTEHEASVNAVGELSIADEKVILVDGLHSDFFVWGLQDSTFLILPHPNGESLGLACMADDDDWMALCRLDPTAIGWTTSSPKLVSYYDGINSIAQAASVWKT